MTFLLEFLDLGLFRHFIVRIQGAEASIHNFVFSEEALTPVCMLISLCVPSAVTFMRGLIL